jgi:hypothetical protein
VQLYIVRKYVDFVIISFMYRFWIFSNMELNYLMSLIYITQVWMCMRMSIKICTLFGFWGKNYKKFQ